MKYINRIIAFHLIFAVFGCGEGPDPQEAFIKYYGGAYHQEARAMIRAKNDRGDEDGFIIVGSSSSHSEGLDMDVFVVRTDEYGNEIWVHHYGSEEYHEFGTDIVPLPDNQGYAISGNAKNGEGDSDAYIFTIDLNGDSIWQRRIQNFSLNYETANSLDINLDKSIVFGGGIKVVNRDDAEMDTYLFKINLSDGKDDPDWRSFRIWGYEGLDSITSIKSLPNGDIILLGITEHSSSGQDGRNLLVYRTNSFGIIKDVQSFGTSDNEDPGSIFIHPDEDSYSLIGTSRPNDQASIYLNKVESRLSRSLAGPISVELENPDLFYEGMFVEELNNDSGYIIGGNSSESLDGEKDIFISLINLDGAARQDTAQFFGYGGNAYFGDLVQLNDGYAFCGTFTFGANTMMGLVKVTSRLSLIPDYK